MTQKGKGRGKWTIQDEFREQKEKAAEAAAHEAALYPRVGIVGAGRLQSAAATTTNDISTNTTKKTVAFPPNSLYVGGPSNPSNTNKARIPHDPRWDADDDDDYSEGGLGGAPGPPSPAPPDVNYEDFIPDSPTHHVSDIRDDPEPALDPSLDPIAFTVADSALAEYVIGETWHRIDPKRAEFVKHHDSIRRANAYLAGLKSEQPLLLGLHLLRALCMMGLVARHLENEIARTTAGTEFVLCRCLVQELSDEDDPELCLIVFLTFRPCPGDALVAAHAARARITLETSEMDLAASGKTAAELHAEAAAPDDLNTELGQMRHVQKEMTRQLLLPATLANYFFDLRRVKDREKKYALDLLNAV